MTFYLNSSKVATRVTNRGHPRAQQIQQGPMDWRVSHESTEQDDQHIRKTEADEGETLEKKSVSELKVTGEFDGHNDNNNDRDDDDGDGSMVFSEGSVSDHDLYRDNVMKEKEMKGMISAGKY